MGQLAENLARIRERIQAACGRAGRDPAEVRLMAVSKTQSPEVVREAYDAGLRLFGENRVQEAADKAEALADHADLEWAMIGHLQTNKARDVAGVRAGVPRPRLGQGCRGAGPAAARHRPRALTSSSR